MIKRIFYSIVLIVAVITFGVISSNAAQPNNVPPVPMPPAMPAPPAVATTPPAVPAVTPVLTWEAEVKEYRAKLGESAATTTYYLTNTSPVPAVINSVVTSCGCTTAHLPPMPWTLAPGADGKIDISMNLAGKMGTVIKTITVNSTAGTKVLQFRVTIPDAQAERAANMQLAQADRQAVFKGGCVVCHVTPGEGKSGGELYNAVCGVCHEAVHRATMVPDLHKLQHPTGRDHWRAWITGGKPGSLMPAFQKAQGGPLSDEQINSLVEYLNNAMPPFNPDTAIAPAPAH